MERCHKLGLIFEYKVGEGKLLVCLTDLNKASEYVEGKAFRNSLYRYLKSTDFNPKHQIGWDELIELITVGSQSQNIQGVANQSDYTINEK